MAHRGVIQLDWGEDFGALFVVAQQQLLDFGLPGFVRLRVGVASYNELVNQSQFF